MNRRDLLAAAGTPPLALLAGCLGHTPLTGLDPVDPPEWPAEPTESAVTWYAARYRAVQDHNAVVDREGGDFRGSLSHACKGALDAETSGGFVVTTSGGGSSTYRGGPFGSDMQGGWTTPLETLLVNGNEVIRARIEEEDVGFDFPEPPFSTRGFMPVNFSSEDRRIEMWIERVDEEAPVFLDTFTLDPEHGRTVLEVVEEPGEYEVNVTVGDDDATHLWEVSDDLRELIRFPGGAIFDVALGIYVLPDGSVEIHELPEERTTERARIDQETTI